MNEQRSPLDQALDVVFYAPVGLVLSAGEEVPRLAERGRATVSGQVAMARLMGRFAVAQGQREAGKAVRQAARLLSDLGVLPSDRGDRVGEAPDGGVAGDSMGEGEAAALIQSAAMEESAAFEEFDELDEADLLDDAAGYEALGPEAGSGHGLAIPGYDALSASQVVQRLAGLSAGELEEVRAYELATRGRRTILNKIAQLQAGSL